MMIRGALRSTVRLFRFNFGTTIDPSRGFCGTRWRRMHSSHRVCRSTRTNNTDQYHHKKHILVVGDGDFSFSRALAKGMNKHRLFATSLDTFSEVCDKYKSAYENIQALHQLSHVTVCHQVDATNLSQSLQQRQMWDDIIWNFPYPNGKGRAGTHSSKDCQLLLSQFLSCSVPLLNTPGRIHVTTLDRQQPPPQQQTNVSTFCADRTTSTTNHTEGVSDDDTTTVPDWNVPALALQFGMELIEERPFLPKDYPGYVPKRSFEDSSFPRYQSATTLVFGHAKPGALQRYQQRQATKQVQAQETLKSFFGNLRILLRKYNQGIYVGVFRDLYRKEFGKLPLPYEGMERLGVTLKRAQAVGVCRLEERPKNKSSLWIVEASSTTHQHPAVPQPALMSQAASSPSHCETDPHKFPQELKELLRVKQEMNVGELALAYQNHFQRRFPARTENESVGAMLKRMSVGRLELRRGGLWLVLEEK